VVSRLNQPDNPQGYPDRNKKENVCFMKESFKSTSETVFRPEETPKQQKKISLWALPMLCISNYRSDGYALEEVGNCLGINTQPFAVGFINLNYGIQNLLIMKIDDSIIVKGVYMNPFSILK